MKKKLLIVAGIFLIPLLNLQYIQSRAYSLEERINCAKSNIRVEEKRRVDLNRNLADCVMLNNEYGTGDLIISLITTEDSIAECRNYYNEQVKKYKRHVRRFSSILDMLNYETVEYEYLDYNVTPHAPRNLFKTDN